MNIYLKSIFIWLFMLAIAVLSGGLRNALLETRLGEPRAHQIGTIAVSFLFFLIILWFVRATAMLSRQALVIGSLWFVMTILFETIMIRFLMKRPWGDVFADYNLSDGRLWPIVLVTILIGPYIVARRNRQQS